MVVYLWLSEIGKRIGKKFFGVYTYSPQSVSSFYGFHFDINRQQGQLLAAFRAFSIIILKNFVRRLKLRAFV